MVSGITQEYILGLVFFKIFISDIACGIECTLNKLTDDYKPNGTVHTTEKRAAIQRDQDMLEKWHMRN